jgi:LSD1 subclass zinc finger protein
MAERLNCGNCGGPLVRQGSESSIRCAHCEHTTEVGGAHDRDDDDDDVDSSDEHEHRHVPAIIVINAGGSSAPRPPPQVVTRTVVVRSGSSFSFITPLIILAIVIGSTLAIRRHIRNSIPSIPSPAAAEHNEHPDPHKHH